MERLEKLIQNLLNVKLSRREFLKLLFRSFLIILISTTIPLKWAKEKEQRPKMKIKKFKFQHLYRWHNLAG